MTTSSTETSAALAQNAKITEDALMVDLADGRTVTVPPAERANWRLIGRGEGIHWPDLDEDVSVAGLLAGHRSGETSSSLRRWLASRPATG